MFLLDRLSVLCNSLFPSIPLVPRRPKSGEPGTGKGKDKKGDKKKDKSADPDKPDTPVPPSDPDEKVSNNHCTVERERTCGRALSQK